MPDSSGQCVCPPSEPNCDGGGFCDTFFCYQPSPFEQVDDARGANAGRWAWDVFLVTAP